MGSLLPVKHPSFRGAQVIRIILTARVLWQLSAQASSLGRCTLQQWVHRSSFRFVMALSGVCSAMDWSSARQDKDLAGIAALS